MCGHSADLADVDYDETFVADAGGDEQPALEIGAGIGTGEADGSAKVDLAVGSCGADAAGFDFDLCSVVEEQYVLCVMAARSTTRAGC